VAHYNETVLKKLTLGTLGVTVATLLFLAIFPVRGSREAQPPRVLSAARGEGPLSAGAAAVALAAPPGTPMGGYPRLRFASQGVRDEPMARAIVLSEPGLAVAIASVDILLVPAELRAKVEARLADLRLDALLVGATHTHAGPGGFWKDALGERFGTGPHDPAWEDALAGRIADAVRAAASARAPARLSVAGVRLPGLVVNRDGGESNGRLLALRVERTDGELVGQVVVFPAHATVHGSRNRLLSGDWPGALARDLPGVTVFLQGAEGDQTWRRPVARPSAHPEGDAENYARLLADEVRRLPYPPGEGAPALAAASAEVTLPAPSFGAVPPFLDRFLSNLLWSWLPERTRVVALQVGPAVLLAVPAEPGEAVGRGWRDAAGSGAEVVSLVGDYVGYVETPEGVRARTGEAKRTYLGPELAKVLGDGLDAARGALPPAPPANR
jgi:hypothetical protein